MPEQGQEPHAGGRAGEAADNPPRLGAVTSGDHCGHSRTSVRTQIAIAVTAMTSPRIRSGIARRWSTA